MYDVFDPSELLSLQKMLRFLPIDPEDEDEVDVINYINNIAKLITVNFRSEQYQFAYFGVHILYMTYIYCAIWKIAQIIPDRYRDAITFAKPYKGKEQGFDINDPISVFSYTYIPEKEIAKIFKIIDLDHSQITMVGNLVDSRNDMAHASGKITILNEDIFNSNFHSVLVSMKNIQSCMNVQIREWYKGVLTKFCTGGYEEYSNPLDIITEQMIKSFKLSVNELLVCNEMSIKSLIDSNKGDEEYISKLKCFKKTLNSYCHENDIAADCAL